MKLYVSVVLMTIGLSCVLAINDNGQPGCKTEAELSAAGYRNIWDPTLYWKCTQKDEAASPAKCPDETGWLDSQKKCVPWDDWAWEEPVEPPSRP